MVFHRQFINSPDLFFYPTGFYLKCSVRLLRPLLPLGIGIEDGVVETAGAILFLSRITARLRSCVIPATCLFTVQFCLYRSHYYVFHNSFVHRSDLFFLFLLTNSHLRCPCTHLPQIDAEFVPAGTCDVPCFRPPFFLPSTIRNAECEHSGSFSPFTRLVRHAISSTARNDPLRRAT